MKSWLVFLILAFWSVVATAQQKPSPSIVAPSTTAATSPSVTVAAPPVGIVTEGVPPGTVTQPAAALSEDQKRELRGYDFAGAIHKLSADESVVPPLEVTPASHLSKTLQHPSVPKAWEPPHADLGATAVEAASLSSNWMSAYNLPLPGSDGRILFAFGSGMPVLVCAPLRVCVIELQPGEHINGQAHIGDGVRWEVSPILEGNGLDATPLIVAKPVTAGLDTDLVIPTDRRTYVVRLVSDEQNYIPRLAFTYPLDAQAQWHAYQAQQDAAKREAEILQAAQEAKDKKAGVVPAGTDAIEHVYFDYRISGDKQMLPERVLDDGQHTYIIWSNNNRFRELPTLMINVKGKDELVNFRVDGNRYIVDRLFNRAVLLVGVGKRQQKVLIVRKQDF